MVLPILVRGAAMVAKSLLKKTAKKVVKGKSTSVAKGKAKEKVLDKKFKQTGTTGKVRGGRRQALEKSEGSSKGKSPRGTPQRKAEDKTSSTYTARAKRNFKPVTRKAATLKKKIKE